MQDDSASRSPSLTKLGKLANTKQFDRLSEYWPAVTANPEYRAADLLALAGQVYRLGARDQADLFASCLIEQVENRAGTAAALAAAREAVRQLPTQAPATRGHLHRLYRLAHDRFAELPQILELLAGPSQDQAAAVPLLDRYCALQPGSFLVDNNFVVPGIVESIDPRTGVLLARFEERRQEYGPATIAKASPRPADFFPALLLYEPDRLRGLAAQDPVAFVKLAVQADLDGVLTYKNLKLQIVRLLGETGWPTWWKEARERLRHDPLLNVGAGSQPSFTLRRQADRYEDRLRRCFDRTSDAVDQLKQVVDYLEETGRKDSRYGADEALLVHFGNAAAKIAVSALQGRPALALAGLAVHGQVAARGVAVAKPNPRAALAVLARIPDKGSLVSDLPEVLLQASLAYLRETQPEHWAEVWSAILLRGGRRLCDQLGRGLVESGQTEILGAAAMQALERPAASPDLVTWLWRNLQGTGVLAQALRELPGLTPHRCLESLLAMTHAVGHLLAVSGEERHLKTLEAARADLMCGKAQPLLAVIRTADSNQLDRLRALMEDNDGLNPALRSRLKIMLRTEHPALFLEQVWPWLDESVIFTTEAGRQRIQAQLQHIVAVELPAAAAQIGEAAAHGDLSENSEWTAALEKRDQLASRAATLDGELKRSRLIDLDMAESDFVNIGTRVAVRDTAEASEQDFTFLGPWDADAERRILNYRAPLAMAFMGRQVGERVVFGEGQERREWEILRIEPAIV